MGFWSNAKHASGYVFNFRVSKWVAYDEIKDSSQRLFRIGRAIFTPEQAEQKETFEEALERLNLTEQQLTARRKEFTRLMIIYLLLACAVFAYSVYIVYVHKNIKGFMMGFCTTIFALSQAFRYHFWVFQIKNRKLGCSISDWFLDNTR